MNSMRGLTATLLLCDWAEVVGGKLYAQGIGWVSVFADQPIQFAIACLIRVPYDQTNQKHSTSFKLVTDDGAPYPDDQPIVAGFEFEVGRPPGMRPGEEQVVSFAVKIAGLLLGVGGYRFELYMGEELADTVSFVAKRDPVLQNG